MTLNGKLCIIIIHQCSNTVSWVTEGQPACKTRSWCRQICTMPCYIYIYIYNIIGSDDARLSYCVFSIFKRRPSTILYFHIFAIFVKNQIWAYIFTVLQNKIGWRSDNAWPSYCIFSVFKRAANCHLRFSYYRNFCEKFKFAALYLRHHSKFGEDRTIRLWVIAYFQFSNWRPSAILDLVWSHSRPPTTWV